ncbi:MAG: P-loop NTPase family protein [Candidatus Dormibacteria bacterium]
MERVAIVGNSGSGKTTLGRRLSALLDAPLTELDAIKHQPGWTEIPREEFRARVASAVAGARWVVDGNYDEVRDLVWARADTVVWLDLDRRVVMWRLLTRTLGRWVRRAELWNGNRERARDWLSWNPDRSVIRWAWVQHGAYRERYEAAFADPSHAGMRRVRLRSTAQVDAFLAPGRAPRPASRSR